ncbi:hypothetical protein HDU97_003471 [Phlyctochytrium planicorne]|nr:hypothetical protein HDU97_003471 [Phlyctochytrium planicorne]
MSPLDKVNASDHYARVTKSVIMEEEEEYEGLDAESGKALFEEMVPNFVSKHVKIHCDKLLRENGNVLTNDILKPSVVSCFAAVVMADVSGYSALSATLAERGPIGAEILGKTMKRYLDKIIETIESHGGDIVKFAGDAVIVCWKMEEEEGDGAWELPRAELVLKASYCCMDLINNLGTYEIDIQNYETKILRLHLGIGAGTIFDVHVGGEPGRWEHFVTGDAIKQLSYVLDLAKAGELAMSHAALKWVSCVVDIETINIGNYDKRCIIIHGLEHAKRKYPVMEDLTVESKPVESPSSEHLAMYKNFINDSALFKLQADINQSRLFRLESNLSTLLELYELRQVTTVFMRLEESITRWDRKDSLTRTQDAISIVQNALKKYEGSLRQVHVDDKGAVVLAFFGLPPLAHQNDASHGVRATLEIRDHFASLLDEFSIGVTTGVVSIGGVGNISRTEYAVMGDSINMAARLMCHANAAGAILCDEKTYNLCENEFLFERLGEARIKGKAQPINIFRPTSIRPDAWRTARRGAQNFESIGRTKEKNVIKSVLASGFEDDASGVVIVEADGGQGLSTLLDFTKEEAGRQRCYICSGTATETERSTGYFAFRDIIIDLLGLVDDSEANDNGILQLNFDSIFRQSEKSLNDDASMTNSKPSSSIDGPASIGSIHNHLNGKRRRSSMLSQQVSLEDEMPSLNRSYTEKHNHGEKLQDAIADTKKEPNQTNDTPKSAASRVYRSMTVRKPRGRTLSVVDSKDSFPSSLPALTPKEEQQQQQQSKDVPGGHRFVNVITHAESSIGDFDRTFEARVNAALQKLREPTHLAGLFDLVMPFEFQSNAAAASPISPQGQQIPAVNTPIGLVSGPSMAAVGTLAEAPNGRQSLQPGKIRMKEFSELIRRIVNALSMTNPLAIIINEAQWMDTLSWELLWEIVNTCPKTAVFIFSRPERSFDNEDRVSLFRKFKRLTRTTVLCVEGLSIDETRQMVIATWPGKPIKNVINPIVENIYRRTNGNPLYIKSLVVAWKDSGQYRIDKDGNLAPQSSEFDFEGIVVGYDLKSIVVAHFDRLDRDFQLFLKVSSVLGQRFLLEDVLYFLSDIPGFREMLGAPVANVTKKIEEMDKYGYLQRIDSEKDGLYYQFKSAVVRNCIYSMMNEGQRQQVHLRIAKYYEKMLSPENSHRLLIPLYEHYKETGLSHQLKILQYLEEVCHFYYQKHSMTDAVKHYNLLLEQTRQYQLEIGNVVYDRNMVSRWNRELGEAYFARGDVGEASSYLCESLRLVGHTFPDNWIILYFRTRREMNLRSRYEVPGLADSESNLPFKDTLWSKKENDTSSGSLQAPFDRDTIKRQNQRSAASLNSERSVWQGRWDNTYVAGPMAEKWVESFAALPRVDDAAAKAELARLVSSTPELAVLHNIRLSLMTIAEVKLSMESMQEFKYAILCGLNISEKFPHDCLYARFLALAGYMFWLLEYRRGMALKYLDAADKSDNRSDLGYSTQILAYTARTLFLMGLWDEGMKRYETVLYLNPIAGDIAMREESMRMRSILLYHMGPRAMSANVARDLYALSIQEDHWIGKFWGCFLILANLLSTINSLEEIQDMRRTFNGLWDDAPAIMVKSVQLQTARLCLLAECDFRLGLLQEPIDVSKNLEKLFKLLKPHSWQAAIGLHHMANAFHSEFVANKLDTTAKRHIDSCLRAVSKYLRKMKGLALSEPLRALNDGTLDILRNKKARAVRKWKQGLSAKRIEFMHYIQALLHERVAKYSENQEDAEKNSRNAQRIYRRIGATWDCERMTLF